MTFLRRPPHRKTSPPRRNLNLLFSVCFPEVTLLVTVADDELLPFSMDCFSVLIILIICKSWLGKKEEEERIGRFFFAKCILSSIMDKRNNNDVMFIHSRSAEKEYTKRLTLQKLHEALSKKKQVARKAWSEAGFFRYFRFRILVKEN
ncbi:transmembrane protein, putative [Medicago truncatula]|uniref:Transmembrane protein, putative n=1 Tax=Medicago truncatula TaxID=3880 RepID=G7LCG7_MEDTR|nr:transmembrane protein, putative [Medicago truncatula]